MKRLLRSLHFLPLTALLLFTLPSSAELLAQASLSEPALHSQLSTSSLDPQPVQALPKGTLIGVCNTIVATQLHRATRLCSGVLVSAGPCDYGIYGGYSSCIGKPSMYSLCEAAGGKFSGEACYSQ